LGLNGYYPDNLFGIFVFSESLKEQLHIEQKDKFRKKRFKRKAWISLILLARIFILIGTGVALQLS
jgi:hypothetical protein